MINSRVLEEILQKPLGPYRDGDILHERLKGPKELVLYSFILELDGRVTGLDVAELRRLQGPDRDERKFRFRGILKIANPDWLSEFGRKTIETALNLRAKERAMGLGEGSRRAPPELTLDYLFERHLKKARDSTRQEDETCLTVLIQGEKNMSAVYMVSNKVPNGLLWSSKAHNREYQIATMDVETYSLSENFFWRWRLFAVMEKIDKQYPFVSARIRTPIWFVERYMQKFACPSEDEHQRLIFDEEDSDVDEMGRTVTRRHLLKPHTSEILGLFAAHAGWFVTNNVPRRNQLLDLASWEAFATEVKRQRKEAAEQGVMWGWPKGQEDEDEDEDEEDEGDEDDIARLRLVKENPVIGKSTEEVVRKIQRSRARLNRQIKSTYSSDSGSEGGAPGGAEYVSDFSEPSDAEENDSDYWVSDEEVMDRIPWQLQLPPSFPDVDGRWWCPLQECNYQIDLYDLTEEERRGIPEGVIGYVLQKQWRNAASDELVLRGFRCMVTNHYFKHFQERGVRAVAREGRMRFTLVDGRRRREGSDEPIRGPMPVRGALIGESRVVPIVHAPQAGHS